MARAFGVTEASAKIVAHDAIAVTDLTRPESRYTGDLVVTTSMKWVKPQEIINKPNSQNIGLNGRSRRFLAK
jgi:hypothetical protein